ncbi:hypothetical protein GCM10010495_46350 [Kitasatospora herbaricolor]|uniref:hypothetical protein n=1 Tax=Kitasatospora herbaricolor TaxID=68217 RepID=UPI00174DFB7A|nr:hypothetical protein [Kitasatospora herbaricolor]MDQ0312935.1 hypothetical protein [Kitasatospora herbaricolor]GGV25230.1 hypothetical protein GCM10010495_46350 [Kitasatospora herbaricolor]
MSPGWRITLLTVAGAAIVSTPLVWLLDGADTGQLVGASVQGAAGITALAWAWFRPSVTGPTVTGPTVTGPTDVAAGTGKAKATSGGRAVSGVRRPGGAGTGSARAERTGDASADGSDSSATTGIDHG